MKSLFSNHLSRVIGIHLEKETTLDIFRKEEIKPRIKPLNKNAQRAAVIVQPQTLVIPCMSPSVSIKDRVVASPTPIEVLTLLPNFIESNVPAFF